MWAGSPLRVTLHITLLSRVSHLDVPVVLGFHCLIKAPQWSAHSSACLIALEKARDTHNEAPQLFSQERNSSNIVRLSAGVSPWDHCAAQLLCWLSARRSHGTAASLHSAVQEGGILLQVSYQPRALRRRWVWWQSGRESWLLPGLCSSTRIRRTQGLSRETVPWIFTNWHTAQFKGRKGADRSISFLFFMPSHR